MCLWRRIAVTDDVLGIDKWQNGKMSKANGKNDGHAHRQVCSRVSTSRTGQSPKSIVPNVSQEVCFWEHASDVGDTRLFLMWKYYERLNLGSWESYTDYMVFYFTRGGCHVESIVIGRLPRRKCTPPRPIWKTPDGAIELISDVCRLFTRRQYTLRRKSEMVREKNLLLLNKGTHSTAKLDVAPCHSLSFHH